MPLTVFYAVAVAAMTFFVNLFKLYYHNARPFWSSDAVQAFQCSTQYGNPSGHSLCAFATALLIALAYSDSQKSVNGSIPKAKMYLALGTATLFGTTVAYSRLFLGVHSLD